MLLPIFGIGRLVSRDPRPLRSDKVTRAIKFLKHADHVTPLMLSDLRAIGGVSAQLVGVGVDWSPGWPDLQYEVEQYELERPKKAMTLFRYADDDRGVWWAPTAMSARLHGAGFHTAPRLWERRVAPDEVLAKFRTRFGKQLSPAEYIVEPPD